jgi:hypothetical protein
MSGTAPISVSVSGAPGRHGGGGDASIIISEQENEMTKKGLVEDAKNTLVDAAKVGAEGVKTVGSEALSAAAAAAAGVVLERVSQALGAGQKKVDETVQPMQPAPGDTDDASGPARRGSVRKKRQVAKARSKSPQAKRAVKKTRAAKQQPKTSRPRKTVSKKKLTRNKAATRKQGKSRTR